MADETRTWVWAGLTYTASHWWPDPTPHRRYLGSEHIHDFQIRVSAEVTMDDRQIEFHDLRDQLSDVLTDLTMKQLPMSTLFYRSFGSMSCEMICQEILLRMPLVYEVSVMEDDYCGASSNRSEMEIKPPKGLTAHNIITLCGSTRFKAETLRAARKLSAEGWIVEMVEFFSHADEIELTDEAKARVDQIHKDKIRSSHAIFVVNPGGYVGESTYYEIKLARELGLPIYWLEPEPEPAVV